MIKLDTKRGRDFSCIAQLVLGVYRFPYASVYSGQALTSFLLNNDDPRPSHGFKKQIEELLVTFVKIASDSRLNQAFRTSFATRLAPVEFVGCGESNPVYRAELTQRTFTQQTALVLTKRKKATLEAKAQALYDMRQYIRQLHKDIRNNERVILSIHDFLDGVPLAEAVTAQRGPTRPRKRRREVDEDEDEEYRPRRNPGQQE